MLTKISHNPNKSWSFKDENGTEYIFPTRTQARNHKKELLAEIAEAFGEKEPEPSHAKHSDRR